MGVYNVYGQITFDVDCEIEANSEAEAKELMMTKLMDYYNLGVSGAYHDQTSVELDLDFVEYED